MQPPSATAQLPAFGQIMTLHTTHCTLHTSHGVFYTAHFTVHFSHCTLHTAHSTRHTAKCTLYTAHWALHTVFWKLHTVNCTLYTVQCTLYTAHCILHNAHCTLHLTLNTVKTNQSKVIGHYCPSSHHINQTKLLPQFTIVQIYYLPSHLVFPKRFIGFISDRSEVDPIINDSCKLASPQNKPQLLAFCESSNIFVKFICTAILLGN